MHVNSDHPSSAFLFFFHHFSSLSKLCERPQMSEDALSEREWPDVTTPPCTIQGDPPTRAPRSQIRDEVCAPGPRQICFAHCMDRALRPAVEPPLFVTLRSTFWNECLAEVNLCANSSAPVQGNDQNPGTQHAIAEGARAILGGDCLAAAHAPLDGETPLSPFFSRAQASPCTASRSTSSAARSGTSSARRSSAPVGTKKAAAKRGSGRASLPTPRRVSGMTRSLSMSVVEDENASAEAGKFCDDSSVHVE